MLSTDLRHTNGTQAVKRENYVASVIQAYFVDKGPVESVSVPLDVSSREYSLVNAVKYSMNDSDSIIAVTNKGGRGNNYDLMIEYSTADVNLQRRFEIKGSDTKMEHSSIEDIPQFLSLAENHESTQSDGKMSYAEYYYNHYLGDFISSLRTPYTGIIPTIEEYKKYVYNSSYSKHEFFEFAKANETAASKKVVDRSIDKYLEENVSKFDVSKMIEHLRNTQMNKVFLFEDASHMWHMDGFLDCHFRGPISISLKKGARTKLYHTLVLSLEYCTFEYLLRWKNHKGILYPAWQIKAIRKRL